MMNVKNMSNIDLRFYMAMISQCDYFVGVDSVGQHMARAFNKPGLVIMGSTFEKNVTYPDHFKIYRNGVKPTYSPIRIGGIDCEFADRSNDGVMKFSEKEIREIYTIASTS
jgi:ADP-heptose:LPS heptosyltransferase